MTISELLSHLKNNDQSILTTWRLYPMIQIRNIIFIKILIVQQVQCKSLYTGWGEEGSPIYCYPKSYFFCDLKLFSKFHNPRKHLLWEQKSMWFLKSLKVALAQFISGSVREFKRFSMNVGKARRGFWGWLLIRSQKVKC